METKEKDELNYKQAYYYLFNKVTDIINTLKIIQRKSEDICIDETISGNIEIDTNEILKDIVDNVKKANGKPNNEQKNVHYRTFFMTKYIPLGGNRVSNSL